MNVDREMTTAPEPAAASVRRSLWRTAFVVLLTTFAIAVVVPDVVLPWHPTANAGFLVDAEANVVDVTPGLSVARAGIVAGDTVDLSATPLTSRAILFAGTPNDVRPAQHLPIVFVHAGKRRPVDVVGTLVPRSLADNATDLLLICSNVALPLIGALLVLKRPSRMMWAFFLYCISETSGIAVTTAANLPPLLTAAVLMIGSTYQIAWFWLILFALRFPNDDPAGWRRVAERGLLMSLIAIVPFNVWISGAYVFAALPPPGAEAALAFIAIAGLFFAGFVFVLTYVRAAGSDRARIRWVMFGLVTGFAGQLTFQIGSSLPGIAFAWPIWLINLAQASEILVPLSVAYAVIKHRVFDVRFFIGRAVVYGALTTGVVVVLALVDYLAGKVLSGTGLAAIGEAGVAVIVGLSLNGVHKRLERLVDTTLFRTRIAADRRLRRVSRGLSHASALEAIAHIAVHEPCEAFHFASAAIFRRDESGSFVRSDAVGWEGVRATPIERDDPLVLQLLASKEPVAIADISMPASSLPAGPRRPTVAMALLVRSNLEAIVFYGPHETEEDLDPDEIDTLEHLLIAASGAYDHVRAETAQRRVAELEARLAVSA